MGLSNSPPHPTVHSCSQVEYEALVLQGYLMASPHSLMNTRTSGFSEDEVGREGQGQSRFYPLLEGLAVLVFLKWTENSAKAASHLVARSILNHLIQAWGEQRSSSEASDGIASIGWREAEQRTGWPLPAPVRFLILIFCLVTAVQAVVMAVSSAVWAGLNSPLCAHTTCVAAWWIGALPRPGWKAISCFFPPQYVQGEVENEELRLFDWCCHVCTHFCCLSVSNC